MVVFCDSCHLLWPSLNESSEMWAWMIDFILKESKSQPQNTKIWAIYYSGKEDLSVSVQTTMKTRGPKTKLYEDFYSMQNKCERTVISVISTAAFSFRVCWVLYLKSDNQKLNHQNITAFKCKPYYIGQQSYLKRWISNEKQILFTFHQVGFEYCTKSKR